MRWCDSVIGTKMSRDELKTVAPSNPENSEWIIKNCILPVDLAYDVENDLWAKVDPLTGVARVGLTDVGQTAAGKLQVVTFPRAGQRVGQKVQRGKAVALLESAKWVGPLRFPVDGDLVAVHSELTEHPLWVNLEPYGNGWIVEFLPDSPLPWLSGEEARQEYSARVRKTFRSVAGVNEDFWCVHCNDWDDL